MKTRIGIISILLLIVGCNYFLPNVDEDLGQGYFIKRSVSFPEDIEIQDAKSIILVEAHVYEYVYDSIFIVCSQKNREQFLDSIFPFEPTLKELRHAFKNYNKIEYWIIDKSKQSLWDIELKKRSNAYGPYSKQEYLEKKKALGVPDSLKLEFEKENK